MGAATVRFEECLVDKRVLAHTTYGKDRAKVCEVTLLGFSEDLKMLKLLFENGETKWDKADKWVIDSVISS